MMNKVVRLTKKEFELDNGDIFPIEPPLEEDMSIEDFQICYERAVNTITGINRIGSNDEDSQEVGCRWETASGENAGRSSSDQQEGD
jgi:hypothetical protein